MAPLSKSYRRPITLAMVSQLICLLLASIILDGGFCLRVATIAAVGYWGGLILMLLRRPANPTKVDLALIGCGYFIAIFITFFAFPIAGIVERAFGLDV